MSPVYDCQWLSNECRGFPFPKNLFPSPASTALCQFTLSIGWRISKHCSSSVACILLLLQSYCFDVKTLISILHPSPRLPEADVGYCPLLQTDSKVGYGRGTAQSHSPALAQALRRPKSLSKIRTRCRILTTSPHALRLDMYRHFTHFDAAHACTDSVRCSPCHVSRLCCHLSKWRSHAATLGQRSSGRRALVHCYD